MIRWPRNGDDLRLIYGVIRKYTDSNYNHVLLAFCSLYVTMNTFSIPGPIFLSILSGPLFGPYKGFALVCACATTGCSLSYWLAHLLAKELVERCLADRLNMFRTKVEANRDNLFFYYLFLRITPLLPNWFINISSPILNVSFFTFVSASFLGMIPLNIVHIRTGMLLDEIQQVGGVDFKVIGMLFGLGFLALLPTLFKKKLQEKFD